MKILLINKYHYIRGGAERVFFDTLDLLKSRGHEVITFSMDHPLNLSSEHRKYFLSQVGGPAALARAIYSFEAGQKLEELINNERPDIAHFHFFDQIMSTALPKLKRHQIPVILTAHDYKLICPHYHLNRDNITCPRNPVFHAAQTVIRKRFNNSYAASAAVSLDWLIKKGRGVYTRFIDTVISPSQFLTENLITYGYPSEKLKTVPNFVRIQKQAYKSNTYVLFAGRLSREKGIDILIDTARRLPEIDFVVAGTGDIKLPFFPNLRHLGHQSSQELKVLYQNASIVFFPSIWEEVCPMVVLEAMSHGLPVVASLVGGVKYLVEDGKTGFTFDPFKEDAAAQAAKLIAKLWNKPSYARQIGLNARSYVAQNHHPDAYYQGLIEVYREKLYQRTKYQALMPARL